MDKIITISREYGAGGHSIGQQVAKELGIPFYDRDILKATVQTSGFDPDMVEHDRIHCCCWCFMQIGLLIMNGLNRWYMNLKSGLTL